MTLSPGFRSAREALAALAGALATKGRQDSEAEPVTHVPALGDTDFGFRWGPMLVERWAHVDGRGYVVGIKTAHVSMQVYVSEAGRVIRAEPVRQHEETSQ